MSRTVIHGGLVITASDEIRADVLIEGGRIAALAAHDTDAAGSWSADRRIDATGNRLVHPCRGVNDARHSGVGSWRRTGFCRRPVHRLHYGVSVGGPPSPALRGEGISQV
ncbi:hypothetical protein [Streptomyces sp. NPDC002399]